MSWDFSLKSPVTGEILTVEPHFMYGGDVKVEYVDGEPIKLPNDLAELNVTYNYSSYYYEAARSFKDITETGGIRDLDGMFAVDAVNFINKLIEYIENKYRPNGQWIEGTRTSEGDTSDYWEVTAANALIPLYQLLTLSKMRPDGVWEVN